MKQTNNSNGVIGIINKIFTTFHTNQLQSNNTLTMTAATNGMAIPEKEYIFEVLVIDKTGTTGITKDTSLLDALSYSEKLWKNKVLTGNNKIVDKDQLIEVKIHSIDTQAALNEYIEGAFVLVVKGQKFEEIERFRHLLLVHLRKNLSFTNIRILTDDISTKISNDIYPLINKVENILRRYLILFFTQKIGVDWWGVTAPGVLSEKISLRKNNEKIFSTLCDTDVTLIDFDDLGELIYKQTSGFNRQENIVNRIMSSDTIEDLNILKQELQGNYTKYFKEAFQDNNFDKKWKSLFEIRNKVAHNNLFIINDFLSASQLVDDLTKIIKDAENKIDSFKFSIEEQIAIRQNSIDVWQQNDLGKPKMGLKILGKIELPDEDDEDDERESNYDYYDNAFKVITEEEFLKELSSSERNAYRKHLPYIGLKHFVSRFLGEIKGYAVGPTYSLANILRDKGLIVIYDVEDKENSFSLKAIKLNH